MSDQDTYTHTILGYNSVRPVGCSVEEHVRVPPPGFANPEDVLGVVVSFNGLQGIRESVHALRGQVGHVHIVDNGSDTESLAVLEALGREPRITVELLGENHGVGHALNRGVRHARERGYAWLLTMDQDSIVDGSFIAAYRVALEQDPEMACLTPSITSYGRRKDAVGGVIRIKYAITSGSLVRVSLFDEIGLYDESLFLDYIDFDFCLRLRRAGHTIHRVPGATMQHQLGDAVRLPFAVRNYYSLHSPGRRYYMSRNFMYLAERYLFEFPGFMAKLGLSYMILLLLIGFLDPSPLASYRATARGVWDYVLRKKGRCGESAA